MLSNNNLDMMIRSEASNIELIELLQPELNYLKNQYGVEIKYEVGDAPIDFVLFTDTKPIYIERKTPSDFAASIADKRLFDQANIMKEEASRGIFLIEGSFFSIDKYHPDSKNGIIGAQRSLIKNGHEIYFGFERDWTVLFLRYELEQLKGIEHKRRTTLRAAAGKDLTLDKKAQYIVEGFTGIGGAASQKIRQNSDSLWQFLSDVNYKTDSIDYISKKIVIEIKETCMNPWRIKQ